MSNALRIAAAPESHEEIFMARYELLRKWALHLSSHDLEQAEDLLQEAFVQFTLTNADPREIKNLDAYLYGLLRILHLAQLRRSRTRARMLRAALDYDAAILGLRAADPRGQMIMREQLRRVCQYACRRKETSKAGSVLILRFFLGYYPAEIARIGGCARSAVEERLRIARAEAKAHLDDPEYPQAAGGPEAAVGCDLAQPVDLFLRDLRRHIYGRRGGTCLSARQWERLYAAGGALDCATLGHLSSCPVCLDVVNELLGLPLLDERHPIDSLGKDTGGRGGGGEGGRAQGRRLLRGDAFDNLRVAGGSAGDIIVYTSNAARSDYHTLRAQLSRRLSHGLEGFAAYVWARSTDTASDDSSLRLTTEPDRGPSNFDVRHAASAALTYQLPALFKRSRAGAFARHWSADALLIWRGATPVDVTTVSELRSGGLVQFRRPNLIPGVPVYVRDPRAPGGMYIDPRAFTTVPGAGEPLGRNALRGFGASQVDVTLRRRFELGERFNLQLRAEVYNLFNHPNFENPSPVYAPFNDPILADPSRPFVSTQTLGQSLGTGGTFGGLVPMYQIGGPRSVQLGVKLQF